MIIKREFNVEKLEDKKKILVKVYIEDERNPEDVIKIIDEGQKSIQAIQKDLDSIPEQTEARIKTLTEQRDMIREEIVKFQEVESYAKLWTNINEKVEDRSPRPTGIE